jgi:hypothetical protein
MNISVDIAIEFEDDEANIKSVKDFFASFATVHVNKAEPKVIKSWDKAIEIVLTIIGTWASEKYVLDPLADKAGEWLNGIKNFWEKSGFQHKINVIIKFEQDNFEIRLIGTHEPDVLKQVWQVAKDVIELLETQSIQVDKIRITTNADQSLLIIGYSGNQPKYTINLDKKVVSQIKASSTTDESEFNPEVELWVITQLEKRLEYLKFIKQKGYNIPESEITELEEEIQGKKGKLALQIK